MSSIFLGTVPNVVASNRILAQTAAVASVATYTPGADGSYLITFNVNCTAGTTFSFNTQVTYTDEGGTARTGNINVAYFTGAIGATVSNTAGLGPYEGLPHLIRAKGGTPITLLTSAAGTYTSVTFNIEGSIQQVA